LLVVLFLRGGIDGLNLVVPHAEAEYHRLRPGLAVPRPGRKNGALDLDGFFGLHPKAAALAPHFKARHATAVHAVGHSENTRSHFEEQDLWETSLPKNDTSTDGWLNRHLASVQGDGPLRAIALSNSLPRLLRGPVPALAIRGLNDVTGRGRDSSEAMRRALEANAGRSSELWTTQARATLDLLEELRGVEAHKIPTRVAYPDSYVGGRLREVSRLRRAGVGLEVAMIDIGGWDTHQNQGGVDGNYGRRVLELSGGIDAFLRDFEDELDEVLVLTLSEFGRTAFENGTGGTDHGWGNVMLSFGGGLRSSAPVLGAWPGLEPEQLNKKRDLRITTDFRDVLGEVLTQHLGNPDAARILARPELRPVGLL
jgi:uncharacterized protein (DUF1501 family)